jgi:transposase
MRSLKKNLQAKCKEDKAKPIYFFDEARFGTHSKIGHGWFKKGSRTPVKVKLGFQNFYLYSAVDPESGKDFTLMLPNVNTDCMNIFLSKIAEEIQNQSIIIIMDGAGWHRSKDLEIPSNIEIIYLPPYSPELNPVERMWLYIKQRTIRNKVYDTLESLEEVICDFVCNKLNSTILKSVCCVDYL